MPCNSTATEQFNAQVIVLTISWDTGRRARQDRDAAVDEGRGDAVAAGMPCGSAAHGIVQAHASERGEVVGLARPGTHAAVAAAGCQQLAAVRLRAQTEHIPRLPAVRDPAFCQQQQKQSIEGSSDT